MNILKLIQEDHVKVKELFKAVEKTTVRGLKTRKELFDKIYDTLTVHTTSEEETLYSPLTTYGDSRDQVLEGYEEHHVANLLLNELQDMPLDDERWLSKLVVLRENIEHHVKEEERDLFGDARKHFTPSALEQMGAIFLARKDELLMKRAIPLLNEKHLDFGMLGSG